MNDTAAIPHVHTATDVGIRSADYVEFLRAKAATTPQTGFTIDEVGAINPMLKPHQQAAVRWAVQGGRRAIFAAFGLGKSVIQLEVLRLITEREGGRGLIVAPLGVRQEFKRDADMLGIPIRFIRRIEEAGETGLYLTNYETVRDGKLDPRLFTAASLDEASVLRGFGGVKTFREFMRVFAGDGRGWQTRERGDEVKYRFVATATPSPNEYIELLSYAAFLGVMEVSEAKTRFFKRDSTQADKLTLHAHKEREFWLWVASWALFIQRPSDLGFSDEGYTMPPMDIRWHEVPADHAAMAGQERDGQQRMFADATVGVSNAARVKRDTLAARVAKLLEIRAEEPDAHRLIWHDLEAERHAIEQAIPGITSVYGAQDLDTREQAIIDFSDGLIRELAAKPVIAGSGCNFQRHCSRAVFLGIGFKFNDFLQAVHRVLRFLQTERVRLDIIYSEAERGVRKTLERKWAQHNHMVEQMSEIIRKYGLSHAAMAEALNRSIGVERIEVSGRGYRLINADAVEEARRMEADSVDLIVTSVPFSTQYEYTPSYNDFGHTDNDAHFWQQMDYLTPELLRMLRPGRVAAIHVKDRITPGGMTGLGFQTVSPFHADAIYHYRKHGFGFLGMKTVVTDVVRENNQTYRLGWTEQCKDGSKMGAGLPEYVLLFRKPPSDTSNGYADTPVVKSKFDVLVTVCPACGARLPEMPQPEDGSAMEGTCPDCDADVVFGAVVERPAYTRARWQLDAHGFTRSSGDRLMGGDELHGLHALAPDQVYKVWKAHSMSRIYDFDHHVQIGEALEARGALPPTFMLLPPHSWHPDVWTDVTRMRTLNGAQSAAGREMHLCPLQFDIVDRLINQFTMEGETVYDPFGGIMTVPYCALKQKRKAIATELNHRYFLDGCKYAELAADSVDVPSLFDFLDERPQQAADDAA